MAKLAATKTSKKGAVKKGASRNNQSKSLVIDTGFVSGLKKPALLLCFVSFLVMAIYVCIAGTGKVLDTPVKQVEVQGILKFQAKSDIQSVINQFIEKGFIASDLAGLREALLALPWVYAVNIRRTIDNGLDVEITENQVQALFDDGKNQYIMNQDNDLFKPANIKQVINSVDGLVSFYGKEPMQVLAVYTQLKEEFSGYQLRIRDLQIMPNKRVLVSLHNGVQLVMNKDQLTMQLEHFHTVMNAGLQHDINTVKSIDLRYSNGAAVAWQKQNIALNTEVGASR